MQGQAQLLQIIATLRSPRHFAGLLHGWQQQWNQNSDDCDDHQQFNQGETRTSLHSTSLSTVSPTNILTLLRML